MAPSGTEWSGLKRAKKCVGCERDFADAEWYYSMLFDEGPLISREDYCGSCRKRTGGDARRPFSSWRGRFRAEAPAGKEEPIAKSIAERLLRKYIDSRDPAHVNVRFILALMMERKRRLIPRDRVSDPGTGRATVVYELAGSGETFLIEDPGLRVGQAKEVQQQVKALLEQEGL